MPTVSYDPDDQLDPAPMARSRNRAVRLPANFGYTMLELISRPMFFVVLLFVMILMVIIFSVVYDAFVRLFA